MSVYPRNKTREIWGLLYLSLTLLLYLSLFSYNPLDPSLNVVAPHSEYQNLIGKVGAWCADLLFQSLGWCALCLPVPLLFLGFKKLTGMETEYLSIKAIGFVGVVLSLSSTLTVANLELPFTDNFPAGGVIGLMLSQLAVSWLNEAGALLLSLTLLLLSLVLTTRFSVERILKWSWSKGRIWTPDLPGRFDSWRNRRSDREQLVKVRNDRQKMVTQSVPRRISFDQEPGAQTTSMAHALSTGDARTDSPMEPVLGKSETVQAGSAQRTDHRVLRPAKHPAYQPPSLEFLQDPLGEIDLDEKELIARAQKLSTKCAEFDVHGRVLQIHPGPVVTTFEFKPDPGIKYSRITSLADDLCLALRAESIRIDRVPGKNTVGIEVPNRRRRIIYLKEILASPEFQRAQSPLTLGLGQRINGGTFLADLSKMPHLLIAGSTGSGKSVGLNCMVCSILYRASPDEVRFILVDPKRLELGLYDQIPHLLTPIVTDPKKAANALGWAVREMEERYRTLAEQGVRNISQYNALVREETESDSGELLESIPNIVIIVDELADLMMTAGKEVEMAVTRLAQMARAVGIHLILATQRPSVDVITGLIKANFPCRISFRVSSKIDSRTILDSNGAEQLLGMGDSLYLSPETVRLMRIHGAFISEKEISRIVRFLRRQGEPQFQDEVLMGEEESTEGALIDVGEMEDKLYDEAARFVVESRKASTSLLQRRFRIGYGRAARLLDIMEHEGIVGPSEGSKPREILVPPDYFDEVDRV